MGNLRVIHKHPDGLLSQQINNEEAHLLGYLYEFQGEFYDPSIVRVGGIEKDEVVRHNKVLDEVAKEQLKSMGIGDSICLYFDGKMIRTWNEELICSAPIINGKSLKFIYDTGRVFRGIIRKDCDLVCFKRIQ